MNVHWRIVVLTCDALVDHKIQHVDLKLLGLRLGVVENTRPMVLLVRLHRLKIQNDYLNDYHRNNSSFITLMFIRLRKNNSYAVVIATTSAMFAIPSRLGFRF